MVFAIPLLAGLDYEMVIHLLNNAKNFSDVRNYSKKSDHQYWKNWRELFRNLIIMSLLTTYILNQELTYQLGQPKMSTEL